jgi:hypothetical protein
VESGKIINQLEYDEMLEFSTRSLDIFKQLKAIEGGSDPAGIGNRTAGCGIDKLANLAESFKTGDSTSGS